MSGRLDAVLRAEMARWESRGLRRDLDAQADRRVPREKEFSSNDYLSLAFHDEVREAARKAISMHGAGGRAARLLGGGCELDARAERAMAEWMSAESALLFQSGYQANIGLITTLVGPAAALFSDQLNHASIVDAARLARTRVHVYRHADLEHLESLLAAERGATGRFVVTETVFSMDGDAAPLLELHELCERHDACLILDEAHAAGVIGPEGAGGWRAVDPDGAIASSPRSRLAARVVTGGKALGVSGAFVVGSAALREHVSNRARSFVFSTATSPAVSGALCASIGLARDAAERRERVTGLARGIARGLSLAEPAAAIVPLVVGDSAGAVDLSETLFADHLDVRAVRPPTVPEGSARLRIVCHAHNTDAAIASLVTRLQSTARPPDRVEARPMARVLCVAGTDTGVGKTVVSAILARAALQRGATAYWKPVQTGTECDTSTVSMLTGSERAGRAGSERGGGSESERVGRSGSERVGRSGSERAARSGSERAARAGSDRAGRSGSELVACEPRHRFDLPASPHTAAAAQGEGIDFEALRAAWRALRAEREGMLIIELAGGLLVPLDETHTQADLLARERPEIVLVARSGLGTLNHTLLTLEALSARGLDVRALFLVGERHAANAATLRTRTGCRVFELEPLEPLATHALDAWLDRNDLAELFP